MKPHGGLQGSGNFDRRFMSSEVAADLDESSDTLRGLNELLREGDVGSSMLGSFAYGSLGHNASEFLKCP